MFNQVSDTYIKTSSGWVKSIQPSSDFYSGNGSEEYPFIIKDIPNGNTAVVQLTDTLRQEQYVNKGYYYQLGQDIDLSGIYIKKIGSTDAPFIGHIDGNGYCISNLKLWDAENVDLIGLFNSQTDAGSEIYNIHFKDIFVDTNSIINKSTTTTTTDITFSMLNHIDNVYQVWIEGGSISSNPLWKPNRWSPTYLIRSSYDVHDILITGLYMYSAYINPIYSGNSTTSTISNVYSQGTTLICNASGGSPTMYTNASSIACANNTPVSNCFANYQDITCRSQYCGRISSKSSNYQSYPITTNCYTSDTFQKKSATVVGDKDSIDGLSVSLSLYGTKQFFDGTGIDGTVYLDWDFDNIWDWDSENLRPVLRMTHKSIKPQVLVKTDSGWKLNNELNIKV